VTLGNSVAFKVMQALRHAAAQARRDGRQAQGDVYLGGPGLQSRCALPMTVPEVADRGGKAIADCSRDEGAIALSTIVFEPRCMGSITPEAACATMMLGSNHAA
jgi:hypothetical protein